MPGVIRAEPIAMKFLSGVAEATVLAAEAMDIHLIALGHAFIVIPDAAAVAGLTLIRHVRNSLDDMPVNKSATHAVRSTDVAFATTGVTAGATKSETIALACIVFAATAFLDGCFVAPKICM